MISFTTEVRSKEIGIRKVLGASSLQIVMLFYKDLIRLVAIAALIASIMGFSLMNRWLNSFAYHINLSAFPFLISVVIVFFLTSATMIYQILKASEKNPVEVIKH